VGYHLVRLSEASLRFGYTLAALRSSWHPGALAGPETVSSPCPSHLSMDQLALGFVFFAAYVQILGDKNVVGDLNWALYSGRSLSNEIVVCSPFSVLNL